MNPGCLLIGDKVSYEETFTLRLNIFIMALSGASRSATGSTNGSGADACNFFTAGTSEFVEVKRRPVTLVKLVIQLISWSFHIAKDVEPPINGMKVICMFICTDIAHALLACITVFKCFDIRILILVVYSACRYIICL